MCQKPNKKNSTPKIGLAHTRPLNFTAFHSTLPAKLSHLFKLTKPTSKVSSFFALSPYTILASSSASPKFHLPLLLPSSATPHRGSTHSFPYTVPSYL